MDNTVFTFTAEQFRDIKRVRVACGSISLSFDIIAFAVFLYLVSYHRPRANRPSLRLAAFSCLANAFENIIYIIMVRVSGPSHFCLALQYMAHYMIILGVCFLTLIGINLVLVYVVNFRHRQILEWIYYPYAFVYSGLGLIGPIIYHYISVEPTKDSTDDTCWYISEVKDRYSQSLNFMWVYGFIFFSTVVALICSIIAVTKLVKDSHLISNLFRHRRVISSQLPQVLIRCLLYPLVPLVTNFTGFVMQCIIDEPRLYPGYTLTLANSILRSLGGFLVALIFLNDPVVTEILTGWYDHWFYKHIEEYVIVETKANGYIRVVGDEVGDTRPIVLVSFPPNKRKIMHLMAEFQPFSLLLYCCFGSMRKNLPYSWNRGSSEETKDDNNRDNLIMGMDCEELVRTISTSASLEEKSASSIAASANEKSQKMPMRRLQIPNETVDRCLESNFFMPNILVRRSFSRHIVVEESVNGYFVVVDDKSVAMSYLFIHYSSIHYAKFIHYLLNNPIGRFFHRNTNVVVDVDISVEPLQENYVFSSDPTAEL